MSAAPVIDLPHVPTHAANDSQIALSSVIAFPQRLRAYDMADQPRAISGSSTGTYQYDGNMKRVKSVVDGVTVYNIYDASGSLVHIDDLGKGNKTDYVKGAGLSLARIKKTGPVDITRYLHPDQLGSPVVGTNSLCISRNFNKDKPQEMGKQGPIPESLHTQITRGNLAWIERYTPFGEEINDHPVNDNQAGFTGHIKDSATGLSYMQARYYDPVIGRFLSIDPVTFMDTGNPAMFNRYAYCYDDPVNCTDPDGEFGLVGAAFGAVAGGVGGYITTGSLKGTLSGAVAGGAVGFVAPQLAASAGSGVAIAYAGTVAASASVAGQLTGQVAENVSNGNPAAANLSIDLVATGAAAATGPAAGSVNGSIGSVGAKTSWAMPNAGSASAVGAKIVDKNKISATLGAGAEGALIGGAEKLGDIAGSIGESLTGIPTNLSLTNSSENFKPELLTNKELQER